MPITDSVGAKREMQNPVKGRTDAEVGTQEFVDCRRSPSSESTLNVTSVSRLGAISQEDKKNRVENAKLGKYVRLSGSLRDREMGSKRQKKSAQIGLSGATTAFPVGNQLHSNLGLPLSESTAPPILHFLLGIQFWGLTDGFSMGNQLHSGQPAPVQPLAFHGQPAPWWATSSIQRGQPAPGPPKSKPSK